MREESVEDRLCKRVREIVRDRQERYGLTQAEVGAGAGYGQSQFTRLIHGKNVPLLSTLESLAEGLDVTLEDLFSFGDPVPTPAITEDRVEEIYLELDRARERLKSIELTLTRIGETLRAYLSESKRRGTESGS